MTREEGDAASEADARYKMTPVCVIPAVQKLGQTRGAQRHFGVHRFDLREVNLEVRTGQVIASGFEAGHL